MLLGKELYRALLKEAAALPDKASCLHYRTKIRDKFRKEIAPESSITAVKRVKEAQELLRQLKATNDGYLHALSRTLETTYARRGSQKHSLLKPFISPSIPIPVNTFSPPLASLLTSSIAHLTRPPNHTQLKTPPTLPPRAFPSSEDTRLLGPLTPNRIKKIRLRYFNEQIGKLRSPVTVFGKRDGINLEGEDLRALLEKVGLGKVNEVEGKKRLEELEGLAKVSVVPRPPKRLQSKEEREMKSAKRKEQRLAVETSIPASPEIEVIGKVKRKEAPSSLRILPPTYSNTKWKSPKTIAPRLLRRQYQSILNNSPIFIVEELTTPLESLSTATGETEKKVVEQVGKDNSRIVLSVVKSSWAKDGSRDTSKLSKEDSWWLEQDKQNVLEVKKGSKGKVK